MTDYIFKVKNGLQVNTNLLYATGGQVGINQSSPDANLSVVGTANVSGNVYVGGTLIVTANTTYNANITISTTSALIANATPGSNGQVLVTTGNAIYWGTGTAGSNTQVQFNDSGTANGLAGFTFTKTANLLSIANTIQFGVGYGTVGVSGAVVNTTVIAIGNSTVNASVNSSLIQINGATIANSTGANNSFYFGGQLPAYYTNATNITTGTLPAAQLSGSYTSVTGVGALAAGSLTTGFTAVNIAQGGTGQTTQQAALNALAGGTTTGSYIRGNGTNMVLSSLQAADVNTAINSANISVLGVNSASYTLGSVLSLSNTSIAYAGNTTTLPTVTIANTGSLSIGNSSTTQTTSIITVANSSGNVQITPGTTSILATGSVNAASVNAASHTVGTSTVANSSGVYTGVVNAVSVNAGSYSVGTSTVANSTGVYTGVVNSATITVGSTTSTVTTLTGTSNTGTAIYGTSNSSSGVYGLSNTASGVTAQSVSGAGVYAVSNTGAGVYAVSNTGYGVYGQSNSQIGILGASNTSHGVYGSTNTGAGVLGLSNIGYGVYAASNTGYGLYVQSNTGTIATFTNNTTTFASIYANGNVGIGTSSPSTILTVNGTVTATSFSGAGTGLTGTASSLSIGGNAATATNATTATNLSGGSVTATSGYFSSGVQGTTIAAQGYGVRVVAGSGDTAGIIQFTNYAVNAQWSSISSTNGVLNLNAANTNTNNIAASGAITATGNITAYYSDDRLKTRLGDIHNALDKVSSLTGFYYEANETAQALGYKRIREVGISAQDVQAILPEIVAPAPIDPKYLTVRYERLVPLLIEAIKELSARVEELENR